MLSKGWGICFFFFKLTFGNLSLVQGVQKSSAQTDQGQQLFALISQEVEEDEEQQAEGV